MRCTKWVGVVAGLSLLIAACGGDDDGPAATDPPATDPPAVTEPPATDPPATDPSAVTDPPATDPPGDADEYPQRIVSLSPTHTEMLFAIGAGEQVVAVDAFSNYPEEAAAKMTELSGWQPNVEAIAGYEPDLVVTEGSVPDLHDQLDALGIAWWTGPAAVTFDDVYDQIEQLGALTGNLAEAAQLVSEMQIEIDEITASIPADRDEMTYYHELDPSYFSVTSDTFIGHVYAQLGLRSIADDAEGAGGQYPQLNAEFIVSADPDLVFLACTTYCGTTAESVGDRPGWGDIAAVQRGLVFEMPEDESSRWGPRIVDYYRATAEAVLAALETADAG